MNYHFFVPIMYLVFNIYRIQNTDVNIKFCILSLSMTKVCNLNTHSIIPLLCINLLSFWFFNLKLENLIDVAHLNVKLDLAFNNVKPKDWYFDLVNFYGWMSQGDHSETLFYYIKSSKI